MNKRITEAKDGLSLDAGGLIDSVLSTKPSFILAGPRSTIVAQEVTHRVVGSLSAPEELLTSVSGAFSAARDPRSALVVGAIPFSPAEPVALARADEVLRDSAWHVTKLSERGGIGADSARGVRRLIQSENHEGFRQAVRTGLRAIHTGAVEKVVLARTQELGFEQPIDLTYVLRRLRRDNPFGYTFGVDLSRASCGGGCHSSATNSSNDCRMLGESTGRYLLGASPELLLSRNALRVTSIPLAGTCRRGSNPSEDRFLRARLATSAKALREHRIVVEEIVETLRPFAKLMKLDRQPAVIATPTMFHLGTRIEARLLDRDVSALRIAMALQPTPAVCGRPRDVAARLISEIEDCDRGFFSGSVGFVDAEGNGEFVVAIRCAEVESGCARLFAGAGIVRGSDPDEELAETTLKLDVMRKALGLGEWL